LNLLSLLLSAAFRRPVTAAIILAAVGLQVAVWVYPHVRPDEARQTRRHLGAVSELGLYPQSEAGKPRRPKPQLFGPFDLWEGELWRVTVSGFHHANLGHEANAMHLVMNCLAIAFMGGLLEPRMGRWTYGAFFLLATTVSGIPEFLMSHYAVGLSGGAFALFGCLLVMRKQERELAELLPPSFVSLGMGWLVLCFVLTLLDVVAIANLAHLSGLIYGWLFGQAFYAGKGAAGVRKGAFVAGHLLLLPAAYFLMHPFWLGTYHWYHAREEADPDRRIRRLERAVAWDPALQQPWTLLADEYVNRGEPHRAWTTLLRGLNYNRTDALAASKAQKVWLKFRTPDERWAALLALQQTFGDEDDLAWKHRLGILPNRPLGRALKIGLDLGLPEPNAYVPQTAVEKQLVRLLSRRGPIERDLSAPPVDPHSADSAAEGTTL
jgi:rhomboid protease GluP